MYANKINSYRSSRHNTNEANVQAQWLISGCKWVFADFLRMVINGFHLNCKNSVNNAYIPYSYCCPDFSAEVSWVIDDLEHYFSLNSSHRCLTDLEKKQGPVSLQNQHKESLESVWWEKASVLLYIRGFW